VVPLASSLKSVASTASDICPGAVATFSRFCPRMPNSSFRHVSSMDRYSLRYSSRSAASFSFAATSASIFASVALGCSSTVPVGDTSPPIVVWIHPSSRMRHASLSFHAGEQSTELRCVDAHAWAVAGMRLGHHEQRAVKSLAQ